MFMDRIHQYNGRKYAARSPRQWLLRQQDHRASDLSVSDGRPKQGGLALTRPEMARPVWLAVKDLPEVVKIM
ncbi:MAG: hypothetical protein JWO89_3877 [Verrucomicrobiaceae bacterium]|nr:hypothetical protein [Verrucomicrobiaceae bacterium]